MKNFSTLILSLLLFLPAFSFADANQVNNLSDAAITSTLHVKNSQQPLTDTLITAKVKGKLMQEAVFGDRDISSISIHVETKDGKVYLRGSVENIAQKAKIIRITRSVKGVRAIQDDLTS